jgi:pilus assembly protein CpaC
VTGSYLGQTAASSLTTSLLGAGSTTNFAQAGVGVTGARVNANALLNALQSEGLLTTLAEPNLTTLSGETAHFHAGGEVPIPVPQSFGVTTIQYKSYGVELSFTPTILPGERIAMRVHPSVSEISSANAVTISGVSVPSFIERDAEANVEMASGQTLAIAGLFQRDDQNNVTKFPFLGDVPVLGALFRSTAFQRDETELVILVTPYLTQPVSNPEAFALPTAQPPSTPPLAPAVPAGFVAN